MAKKKSAKSKGSKDVPLEEAMDELQGIVTDLESGQEPLNESLAKFERGMELLRKCHQQIEDAAQRIEVVTRVQSNGTVEIADFDGSSTLERNTKQADEGDSKLF